MSVNKVALVGATGNLGPAILKALLDHDFEVTIVAREGSTSVDSVPEHPNQKIVKVNFNDVESLASAFQGLGGVVSTLGFSALLSQKTLIDAAIKAGVKRFIPSDFGSDFSIDANRHVPVFVAKVEVHDYLEEASKAHPDFSFTSVTNGPLLDWCLRVGLFGNFKTHEMSLYDGGDTKISTTTLASVGKVVAEVFKNLVSTKNRDVRVADTTISQKELIELAKEIDGKEWKTTVESTAEIYQAGLEELKKSEPNHMVATMNQLKRVVFSSEHGPDMEGKLENDLVGLPGMTREDVKELLREIMA